MSSSTKAEIRVFIVENFLFGDETQAPGDEVSLIENDIIDLTGILELVAYLEEHFGIAIADPEIVPENFDNIARLAAFTDGKLRHGLAAKAS